MATDSTGNTPLHIAANLGDRQTVRDLLASHKYEVNCTNSKDKTPLHLACNRGHLSIDMQDSMLTMDFMTLVLASRDNL